jgi:hypothetical protein
MHVVIEMAYYADELTGATNFLHVSAKLISTDSIRGIGQVHKCFVRVPDLFFALFLEYSLSFGPS